MSKVNYKDAFYHLLRSLASDEHMGDVYDSIDWTLNKYNVPVEKFEDPYEYLDYLSKFADSQLPENDRYL